MLPDFLLRVSVSIFCRIVDADTLLQRKSGLSVVEIQQGAGLPNFSNPLLDLPTLLVKLVTTCVYPREERWRSRDIKSRGVISSDLHDSRQESLRRRIPLHTQRTSRRYIL